MTPNKIAPALAKLARPIEQLQIDPANVRAHDERSIDAIKASLTRYGQQKPLVVLADGTVIAGNGTLLAARALGWTKVAVSEFKGTPEEAKAYAIADNRSSELSSWDEEKLVAAMADLVKLGMDSASVGFTTEEASALAFAVAADVKAASATTVEQALVGATPEAKLDGYLNNEIKQVVLYFSAAQYEAVQNRLRVLGTEYGLLSNTDVVLRLLGLPVGQLLPGVPEATPAPHG